MERDQDDTDFDPGSRALRVALVEFLVEASLDNPRRADLINAVLVALKEAPGKQAAATARLEQLAAQSEQQNREAASKFTELGARLETIAVALRESPKESAPPPTHKKDLLEVARAAAQEVFRTQAGAISLDGIREDARSTAGRTEKLLEELRGLRTDLANRPQPAHGDNEHPASRSQLIVPTQWSPAAESPGTRSSQNPQMPAATSGPAGPSPRTPLLAQPVPGWFAILAMSLLALSVLGNWVLWTKLSSRAPPSGGTLVSVPSPPTPTRRSNADVEEPADNLPNPSPIETSSPSVRWSDHWQYALGLTVKSCRLKPGEDPSPDVSVRTCLCPSFSSDKACEPSVSWDEPKQVVALQAVLKAFDPEILPGRIDGVFGRNTVGAVQRLAERCDADAAESLAPAIKEIELDWGNIKAQQSPQAPRAIAVKLRDHVWDALKRIERNYLGCNPPQLRGGE